MNVALSDTEAGWWPILGKKHYPLTASAAFHFLNAAANSISLLTGERSCSTSFLFLFIYFYSLSDTQWSAIGVIPTRSTLQMFFIFIVLFTASFAFSSNRMPFVFHVARQHLSGNIRLLFTPLWVSQSAAEFTEFVLSSGECKLQITAAPFGHHSSLARLQPSVEDHTTTHGKANAIGKQVLTGGVLESPAKTVWTFWGWQSHDPVSPSRGQRCAVSQRMFLWLEKASLELQSFLLFFFFFPFTFSTTTQTWYRSCSTNNSHNIGPG